ncbi:hypothetical protein BH09CHL1_BH09CHL1_00400 [soil metagenome]
MMPPIESLSMIKFMHDELHEKRAASRQRALATMNAESLVARLFRKLFRRNSRQHTIVRGRCHDLRGAIDYPEIRR